MNATPALLSVLTAGITGNARLHERLGSTEALRAADRCVKRIERAVKAFSGRLFQVGADEVIAVFDSADAAVQAAIEMHQRIADLPPISGVKMTIRAAVAGADGALGGLPGDRLVRDAVRLLGVAKSGQILACEALFGSMMPALQALVTRVDSTALSIAIPETSSLQLGSTAGGEPQADGLASGCLRLRYAGRSILIDEHTPVLHMGRDRSCDMVVRDRRASRQHATIERRDGSIVLVDKSTNGTYLTIDGRPEQRLKHRVSLLNGRGVISFAAPASSPDADVAEFEFV